MSAGKTYRLGSSNVVGAPRLIAFAINGYHWKKDRKVLLEAVSACWSIPESAAHALLSGEVPYTVEGGAVVFEAPGYVPPTRAQLDELCASPLSPFKLPL